MTRQSLSIAATMMVLAAVRGDAIPLGLTVAAMAKRIPRDRTLDPHPGRTARLAPRPISFAA